ncbi:MAG: hypothetical protein OEU46_12585 [Alphaproteobacteria bacterium]|nr:hypothetical protein [Alphaproteobacteria bacterium]
MDVQIYSTSGKEFIEITRYPIELVQQVENNTDVGILYAQWRKLGSPPHTNKFQPRSVNTACFLVSKQLPIDFVYTSTDVSLQILPLREMESELIQRQTMDDLLLVKETCKPLYQQVIHRMERFEMCFRRILLPVIDDDGKVEQIYTATRQFGTVEPEYLEMEMA